MRITRLLAALVLTASAAACGTSPVAPAAAGDASLNTGMLGSGTVVDAPAQTEDTGLVGSSGGGPSSSAASVLGSGG